MPAIMKITSKAQSIPGWNCQVEDQGQVEDQDQVEDQIKDQVEEKLDRGRGDFEGEI